MSIENPTLVHFRYFSSLLTNEYQESSYLRAYNPLCLLSSVFCLLSSTFCPLHLSRTLYKSTLFMQNEPNFQKAQMNVTSLITVAYEYKSNWTLGENKPNSNPIKANTKPIKANKMPKQTQFKPNQTQPVVSLPVLSLPVLSFVEVSKGSNLFQTCPNPPDSHNYQEMEWRRRESNPHFRDATAACSRYTTSPILPSKAFL